MFRMKGPEGVCSVSVNGVNIEVDGDGCVNASSEDMARDLTSHGFTPVAVAKPEIVISEPEPEDKPVAAKSSKPKPRG